MTNRALVADSLFQRLNRRSNEGLVLKNHCNIVMGFREWSEDSAVRSSLRDLRNALACLNGWVALKKDMYVVCVDCRRVKARIRRYTPRGKVTKPKVPITDALEARMSGDLLFAVGRIFD